MASVPLTVQDPGDFSYVEGQTYYNELLAHAILKHAAAMADEGYEISFGLNESAWSELIDVLKAAFLEELSPGSGVYVDSVLEQLGNLKQALQDLKYNDEILEIPATPRPIRIHLQGKTIQQ